jgi:hypothetical protein
MSTSTTEEQLERFNRNGEHFNQTIKKELTEFVYKNNGDSKKIEVKTLASTELDLSHEAKITFEQKRFISKENGGSHRGWRSRQEFDDNLKGFEKEAIENVEARTKWVKKTKDRQDVVQYLLCDLSEENVVEYPKVGYSCDCSDCNATGKVTCYKCHGGGRHTCSECSGSCKCNCKRCSGSGNETCYSCSGKGYNLETFHEVVNGVMVGRTVSRACSTCSSSGRTRCTGGCGGLGKITCPTCNGSGVERCGRCGGSGAIRHEECGGYGYHTYTGYIVLSAIKKKNEDITYMSTGESDKTIAKRVYKLGNYHQYKGIKLQSLNSDAEVINTDFKFQFTVDYTKLSVSYNGKTQEQYASTCLANYIYNFDILSGLFDEFNKYEDKKIDKKMASEIYELSTKYDYVRQLFKVVLQNNHKSDKEKLTVLNDNYRAYPTASLIIKKDKKIFLSKLAINCCHHLSPTKKHSMGIIGLLLALTVAVYVSTITSMFNINLFTSINHIDLFNFYLTAANGAFLVLILTTIYYPLMRAINIHQIKKSQLIKDELAEHIKIKSNVYFNRLISVSMTAYYALIAFYLVGEQYYRQVFKIASDKSISVFNHLHINPFGLNEDVYKVIYTHMHMYSSGNANLTTLIVLLVFAIMMPSLMLLKNKAKYNGLISVFVSAIILTAACFVLSYSYYIFFVIAIMIFSFISKTVKRQW